MAAKTSQDTEIVSDINIVPLVDIILVVLIIFMVTTPQSQNSDEMKVDLPTASAQKSEAQKSVKVTLNKNGALFLEGEEVSEFKLKDILKEMLQENPELSGVLIADKSVNYGEAVQILDWIQSQGIKNLSLSVGGE